MCFYIRKGQTEAKIAEEDIHCFKVLDVIVRRKKKTYRSPSQWSHWKLGVVKGSRMLIRTASTSIDEGLHSYKTPRPRAWLMGGNRKIFRAIIPKGTRYWDNRSEYVSKNLKVVGPYKPEKK